MDVGIATEPVVYIRKPKQRSILYERSNFVRKHDDINRDHHHNTITPNEEKNYTDNKTPSEKSVDTTPTKPNLDSLRKRLRVAQNRHQALRRSKQNPNLNRSVKTPNVSNDIIEINSIATNGDILNNMQNLKTQLLSIKGKINKKAFLNQIIGTLPEEQQTTLRKIL